MHGFYQTVAQQIRPSTLERCQEDFSRLRAGNGTLSGGLLTDHFFFPHRLAVHRWRGAANGRATFRDYLRKGFHYPSERRAYEYERRRGTNHLVAMYRTYYLYYGSVNQFRPMIARQLYSQFKPKRILDFCAGWGGRLAAAMALEIDYIGFDCNTELRPAYDAMVALLKPKSRVCMHYCDSAGADFAKLPQYDMVFTSPPYLMTHRGNRGKLTETYRNMPAYADKVDFYDRFLHKVVRNAYQHLMPGGIFALNMTVGMYEDMLPLLGPCATKLPLTLADRHRNRQGEISYKEYIYVWRKPKRASRSVQN